MNELRFVCGRLLLFAAMIAFSVGIGSYANAQQIEQAQELSQEAADTDESIIIDAIVSQVEGNILKLEGGLSIDISKAFLGQITAVPLDRQLIRAGTCIRASVSGSTDLSAPLVAQFVRIRVPNEIMLSGVLQAVDVEVNEQRFVTGGSITILNRTIRLRAPFTQFGLKRKALKVGKSLLLVAIADGPDLVAVELLPGVPLFRFVP